MKRVIKNFWFWLAVVLAAAFLMNRALDRQTDFAETVIGVERNQGSPSYVLSQEAEVKVEGGIVRVSASLTGTIKSVFVKEGDRVEQNQLLAVQDDRDEKIAVELAEIGVKNALLEQKAAKLRLDVARRNLERLELQSQQDAVPLQSVDNQRDTVSQIEISLDVNRNSIRRAETQLETAKYRLSQRRLVSPVSGRVLQAAITAGAGVSAENTSTAFLILPDSEKYLLVRVQESDIDSVFIGQKVDFSLDYRDRTRHQGSVISIGSVFSNSFPGPRARENTVDVIVRADTIPFRIGRTVLALFHENDE